VSYPRIVRISLFPIKSLDSIEVNQTTLLSSGALLYDRQFAIVDEKGRFVNGKRNPKVHLLRSLYSLEKKTVSFQTPDAKDAQVFQLDSNEKAIGTRPFSAMETRPFSAMETRPFSAMETRPFSAMETRPFSAIAIYLSNFFGFPVQLQENLVTGFPDDTESPGPTIISTATLREISCWFSGISLDEMRRRLRANIEIDGNIPPFWEDRLFSTAGNTVSFTLGNVNFLGVNPCQRCVVPTRDSFTGEPYPDFHHIFLMKRKQTLPMWANTSWFNHFYRLSINTRLGLSEVGKTLQVGDELRLK
jgi:uncharacterized protein